ncbi:MAG: hypothetical protein Q8M24_04595 [Pseudolabrys sp.]|nr:hypothetical protein [Pseudolabrys sp.]MDP2294725.1 hypothetical protein [Pseudolabrys sp.]
MARKKKPVSRKAKKARIDLFGPPSLLFGESEATYNELFERVNEALKPADIFEEFEARDLTNAMMDSMRFARLKPALLSANMHTGMQRVLKPLCDLSAQIKLDRPILDADKVAAAWAMGDPNMRKVVDALLDLSGLSMDAVTAETLSYEMEAFEGIDRLAMNADARRHAIRREIERRREAKREALPPPVARMSRLAGIDKAKANDNEKSSKEREVIIEVEVEETGTVTEAIERRPKAVGE